MTGLDQPETDSRRAYVFRNAIDSCRKRAIPALTLSAKSGYHCYSCWGSGFKIQARDQLHVRMTRPRLASTRAPSS